MLAQWAITLKRRWRQVAGALAVLLMFFVPATRAVLAKAAPGHAVENNQLGGTSPTVSVTTASTASPTQPTTTTGSATGVAEVRLKPSGDIA